ncbi:MAG: hypothetical protein KAU58_00315, partial [Candidatus Omnitrophica bacterium]|nr:hypothetical protein [Candidatus Omnitrophota bacterium]
DDKDFPKTAYLPLLEVTLFAIGKYLKWDEGILLEFYKNNIPNVIPVNNLSEEDYNKLFKRDMKKIIIKFIPDAVKFDIEELTEMMACVMEILRKA